MATSKYRYIDGRQFEQQADGSWRPSYHQRLLDQDRLDILAAQVAESATRVNNTPAPHRCTVSDVVFPLATGLLLGGLFFGN
jgi:hypothetical protein